MIEFLNDKSLVLVKDDKIVFESDKPGLRPLLMCLDELKEKHSNEAGFTLYDKVIGLAAARLILCSKAIDKVVTPIVSKKALALLKDRGLTVEYGELVENIMNRDKTGVCPMERKAECISGDQEFYDSIKK